MVQIVRTSLVAVAGIAPGQKLMRLLWNYSTTPHYVVSIVIKVETSPLGTILLESSDFPSVSTIISQSFRTLGSSVHALETFSRTSQDSYRLVTRLLLGGHILIIHKKPICQDTFMVCL